MSGKTLRTFSYRGINVYIREMGVRTYEVLVPFKGIIHAVHLNVLKPRPHEKRNSKDVELEGAMNEMSQCGIQLIDNLFLDYTFKARLKRSLAKLKTAIKSKYEGIKQTTPTAQGAAGEDGEGAQQAAESR